LNYYWFINNYLLVYCLLRTGLWLMNKHGTPTWVIYVLFVILMVRFTLMIRIVLLLYKLICFC
jgi:hypothetical protein